MAARISPPVSLTAVSPLVRGGLRGIVGRGIPDAPSLLHTHPVIPRPRRGRGNPFSFDGATDCHVGPVALLAMTDHSAAGAGDANL